MIYIKRKNNLIMYKINKKQQKFVNKKPYVLYNYLNDLKYLHYYLTLHIFKLH